MTMPSERAHAALATDDPVVRLRLRHFELTAQLTALAADEPGAPIRWSNHLVEHAQDHQQWQHLAAVRAILTQELDEIGQALRRAAQGQYGRCVDCAREIAPRRLQAVPAAVRCVACQERSEARGMAH